MTKGKKGKKAPSEEVRREQLVAACKEQKALRKETEDRWKKEVVTAKDRMVLHDDLLREYNRKQAALDAQVVKLANSLPVVRPGDHEVVLTVIQVSAYQNHGQGAELYARTKAEMIAEEAAEHGIQTKVSPVFTSGEIGSETRPVAFRSVGYVQDVSDAWLIGLKPRWELREMVRRSWSKGVNPRIYNPQIPTGFEEVQGIDFYGRDLDEQ